jgi:lipopolysaccharide export system permease protein
MTVTLRLEKGSTHAVDSNFKLYKKMDFSSYDISLDVSAPLSGKGKDLEKDSKEMTIIELIQNIRNPGLKVTDHRELVIEFNNKFTIPFSCLVFGILGVSLGTVRQRSGKSRGFVVGLFVVMTYYVMQLSGEALGETGRLSPIIGSWAPDIILGGIGILMLRMAADERSIVPFEGRIPIILNRWKEKLKRKP